MKRRCAIVAGLLSLTVASAADLIRSIEVSTPVTAPDDGTFWMQARAAVLPSPEGKLAGPPLTVITLQKTDRVGTHMYHGLEAIWSHDLGRTWSTPTPLAAVDRIRHPNGILEAPVDLTPQFHQRTGKLLVTGATFFQDPARHRDVPGGGSATAYAVYDPQTAQWDAWRKLAMPAGEKFASSRAGCSQRVDRPDGDILLPIYFHPKGAATTYATVVRCGFDGTALQYRAHGTELTVTNADPKKRQGLHEPSLTRFGDRFYLTLRNDERGYVTTSKDGLHFAAPRPWRFDDGSELGSYNTQQHWITHSGGLFLGYTRRGATNDNVFRHRATLFVAEVDPERLVVKRATERILLPNLGGAFGNFGVCNVSADETWVVDCLVDAKPGTPNVYLAKIRWASPNRLVETVP